MNNPAHPQPAAFALPPAAADLALPAPALNAPSGADGQTLIYAATGAPFAFVPHTDPSEADKLVETARAAFESGPWRAMPVTEWPSSPRTITAEVNAEIVTFVTGDAFTGHHIPVIQLHYQMQMMKRQELP